MAITSAFVASQSGLRMTEKWAEVTSTNISNAHREGYVRRGLTLTSSEGGGVGVSGISREVNSALERMHRLEVGRLSREAAVVDGLEAYVAGLGQPGDPQGLTSRLTTFQSSFDLLANNPADPTLQRTVVEAAETLARSISDTSAALGEAGTAARRGIAQDVEDLNTLLDKVMTLNTRIAQGEDATTGRAMLEDELGTTLDSISGLMGIRVNRDAEGRVTLHTSGGTPLIEAGLVQRVTYDSVNGRLFAGANEITPDAPGVRGFTEGRLAGELALQNEILPQMQVQLDELARALVVEFEASDASLAPGQAGLFTDAGAAYNAAQRDGLAARLAVNPAVLPAAGGALWRIRDGIGASVQGAAGDTTQINAFLSTLEAQHSFDTQAGLGDQITLAEFASNLISGQQFARVDAEQKLATLQAGVETIATARSGSEGVNVDDELQQLAAIEQAYAANSQVMRTLTEMIDTLLAAV